MGDISPAVEKGPRISVVLSFRNPGPGFQDALRSLLWQDETDWELIAIDDGSTDGSAQSSLLQGDSRIRLIRHAESAGLAVRLNEAIALARGAYVARMDADDIAFPQRFRLQAEFLDAHPQVDLLASSALMIDDENRPVGRLPSFSSHDALTRRPWAGFAMPHPTWMGRRCWFLAHPYEASARKAQDAYLLYQTFRTSQFAALEQALLAYRYPALSVGKTVISRYHQLRAVRAHGPVSDVVLGCALHGVAVLRDLLAMALGMEAAVIRRRTVEAEPRLLDEWQGLREKLAAARSSTPDEAGPCAG